jgi:hypothetical protein
VGINPCCGRRREPARGARPATASKEREVVGTTRCFASRQQEHEGDRQQVPWPRRITQQIAGESPPEMTEFAHLIADYSSNMIPFIGDIPSPHRT